MNLKIINEILMRIFLDHFLITTLTIALLTITVALYRLGKINLPNILILGIWYVIIISSALIFTFLIFNFFSHEEGLDRLASIPLLMSSSPLFLSFLILIFIYPTQKN